MKYINKLGEQSIWNAGSVELFDFSRANLNQESREEAVCFVASECYGSSPTDTHKLYNKLLTEHCGGPASSTEFVRDWNDTSLRGCLRNDPDMRTFEGTLSEIIGIQMMTSACFNRVATFRLKVPIFIARQIMRHRSFAFQEQSRRYQDAEKAPFEFWNNGVLCEELLEQIVEDYDYMVGSMGVAPEVARSIIPQSAYTTFFIQGDLDAWINYFMVRMDAKAQKEHRELADVMLSLLSEHKPKFFEHLKKSVDIE